MVLGLFCCNLAFATTLPGNELRIEGCFKKDSASTATFQISLANKKVYVDVDLNQQNRTYRTQYRIKQVNGDRVTTQKIPAYDIFKEFSYKRWQRNALEQTSSFLTLDIGFKKVEDFHPDNCRVCTPIICLCGKGLIGRCSAITDLEYIASSRADA